MQKGFIAWVMLGMVGMGCQSASTPQPAVTDAAPRADDRQVGGPCDRCEVMYEGMPALADLRDSVQIAAPGEPGEPMLISGQVMHKDGKSPAHGVVLYIYHTDAAGEYSKSDTQTVGSLHGHLRGWVRTGNDGRFSFRSIRPAPYPGRNIPAHVHIYVKEPGKSLYYIDEVWFEGDSSITSEMRANAERRGGDLIIPLNHNAKGVWEGHVRIILGQNIPNYP